MGRIALGYKGSAWAKATVGQAGHSAAVSQTAAGSGGNVVENQSVCGFIQCG